MANRQEIEETYNFMDEIFPLSFGENADFTIGAARVTYFPHL
jgi:hypothetical protein